MEIRIARQNNGAYGTVLEGERKWQREDVQKRFESVM